MKVKSRTDFGSRLVRARKSAGLTQAELAERTGLGQTTISDAERISTSSTYLVQIAQALGVSPAWLATGEGEGERLTDADGPLFQAAGEAKDAEKPEQPAEPAITPMALELATLFDLLSERRARAMAYSAATQAILSVLSSTDDAAPRNTPAASVSGHR